MNQARRSLRWSRPVSFLCALVLAAALAAPASAEVAAPEWVRALYVPANKIVGLAWKVVPGATAYQVLKSSTSGSGYKVIATVPATMYVDKETEAGEEYYYVLKAIVSKEESPLSIEKLVMIPGFKKVKAAAPTWSVAKADVRLEMGKKKASVALVWAKPAATNIITFNLYRKGSDDADFNLLAAVGETKYTDEAVEIGKSYTYVMTSVDDSFTETERGEERTVEVKDIEVKKTSRAKKLTLSVRGTEVLRRHKGGDATKDGQPAVEILEPFDVVVDTKKELLYVSSTNTRRVVVFSLKGEFLRYIGHDGAPTEDGVLLYPLGMAIDKEGRIYVCDGKRNDVQVFDAEGKLVRRLTPYKDEQMKETPVPKDCAVAADGTLYLLDYANHQVQVYDAAGKYVTRFSKEGVEPGDLRYPNYMALSSDGSRLYVINSGMSMIVVFDKDGKFLGQWGGKKNDIGKFVFIAGVALDSKGNVFVSDLNTNFVQVFTADGEYLYNLGTKDLEGAADLFAPRGLFVDASDRLYSTEGMIGRVSILQLLANTKPSPIEPQGAPFNE